jgi:hypothetical protein
MMDDEGWKERHEERRQEMLKIYGWTAEAQGSEGVKAQFLIDGIRGRDEFLSLFEAGKSALDSGNVNIMTFIQIGLALYYWLKASKKA